MNTALIASTLILSLYTIILMLSEGQKTESRKYVLTVIILVAVSQIPLLMIGKLPPDQISIIERLPIRHWSLLIGPALLLYARTCMGQHSRLQDLFHLLPAIIWCVVFVSISETQLHHRAILEIYGWSITVSLLSYGALILFSLRRYTRWLRTQYSYTNTFIEVKWLAYTAVFLIVHTLATSGAVSMLQWISPPRTSPPHVGFVRPDFFRLIHSIGILTFLFIFSLMAHKQERHLIFRLTVPPSSRQNSTPKSSTGIDFDELTRYMEDSKIYLENTLTLQELSEKSGISRNELSGLINSETGENFFHFINGYRAREFCAVVEKNKYPTYTLLGIALECGFNSKTTFIAAIKREFNKTPSEILRESGSTL